jgi:hypothetical protein
MGFGGEVFLYYGSGDGSLTLGGSVRTAPTSGPNDLFGRSLASIYDPTQVRPSLLQSAAPSADLLIGTQAWQASNPPRLSIYRGRASWTGVTASEPDRAVETVGTGTTLSITSTNWIGDIDGDTFVDAAFVQSGTGTLFIVR